MVREVSRAVQEEAVAIQQCRQNRRSRNRFGEIHEPQRSRLISGTRSRTRAFVNSGAIKSEYVETTANCVSPATSRTGLGRPRASHCAANRAFHRAPDFKRIVSQ